MKVYVITKGSYSDYHICAVTEDKKRAKRLRVIFSDRWDKATIKEYDTEEYGEKEINSYRKCYPVLRHRDGTITIDGEPYYAKELDSWEETPKINKKWVNKGENGVAWRPVLGEHKFTVFADDEEHAVKVAADRFAAWYANEQRI